MTKFLRNYFHAIVGGVVTMILCERAGLNGGWIVVLTFLASVLVAVLFDDN